MKALIICFVSLISLSLTFAATKFDPNAHWANYFAMKMTKIKTPEDITKQLDFTPRHLQEIKTEIENKTIEIPKVKYKVFFSQLHIINEKKKRTVIDFAKFNRSLSLNGKTITLNQKKSYQDYLVDVQRILNVKKKVSFIDLIFSKAIAQAEETVGNSDGILAQFIASVFTSASSPNILEPTKKQSLVTSTLIQTYEAEASQMGSRIDKYETLNFTCDGKTLTDVYQFLMRKGGNPIARIASAYKLKLQPGVGYSFTYGQPEIQGRPFCVAEVVDTGNVVNVTGTSMGNCPLTNENVFNDPRYFGGFTKTAMTCCETEGCYPAVQARLKELAQNYGSQRPAPGFEHYDPVPAKYDGSDPVVE